jgi:2-keto-4-pentenoate hydratase/2-oxohepta-3-ene-1,7-dioic acid hydratase in catechol pathway
MKIICVDNNFDASPVCSHVPVFFLKAETALLRAGLPFYYPDFTRDLRASASVVLRVCRLGRSIAAKFASRYYKHAGIAVDFMAHDLWERSRMAGGAWDCARGFDYSTAVGSDFISMDDAGDFGAVSFSLCCNGAVLWRCHAAQMRWTFDEIIAYVSQFVMLKMGDLVVAALPAYTAVNIGDVLTASVDSPHSTAMMVKIK